MHRAIPGFAVAVAAFIAMAGPAGAQDCTIPDFAVAADLRLAAASCEEVERFDIETPSGSRGVRIVRDSNMHDDFTEPFPLVREGIERAAAALREIGTGKVDDLFVIVSGVLPDSGPAPRDFTTHRGVAPTSYDDECLMIVYPVVAGEGDLGFVVAHEFFHCVQIAVVPDQSIAYRDYLNHWWVEGTAEWFANLAYRGTGNSDDFVSWFDWESPEEPLTALSLSVGAVAFFFWYGESYGYPNVISLMQAMPVGGSEEEQQRVLAGLLSPDGFQAFAQDYLDRELRQPGGRPVSSNPEYRDSIVWAADQLVVEMQADRFVLHRAELVFTCGTWNVKLSGEKGNWAVSEALGDWQRLPDTVEVSPGEERRYRLAAMGTGSEGLHLIVEATRDQGNAYCSCNEPTEETIAGLDQCLIGKWELVEGGMNEWLDRQINKINQASGDFDRYESNTTASNRMLTIRRDGLFEYKSTPYTRSERAIRDDEVVTSRVEAYQAGSGTWSTAGDRLLACVMGNSSSATADIESSDGGTLRIDLSRGYMGDHITSGAYAYSCSETQLKLQIRGKIKLPEPMIWKYQRR